jgi:hypothetical protein
MKKVVLASLLACAAIASGLPSASAQTAVSLGTGAPAANPCPPMPDAEYKVYTDASNAKGAAQAAAIEAYLTAYPQSCVKLPTLIALMQTYYGLQNVPKTLSTADSVLQLDPTNYSALLLVAAMRKGVVASITDPTAKQAALDAASSAATAAQKGLTAPKPAAITDDQFKALQATAIPIYYSAIAADDLNKNDNAGAIENYKKELAAVPPAATQTPGDTLMDMYYLAVAYYQSKPPDYLNCTWYASRVVDYAPPAMKPTFSQLAKSICYKKYHGTEEGFDAVAAAAQSSLDPPAGFFDKIKPAPTQAELIHNAITGNDPATLATSDKEMVFQFGSPEDAAKVWDAVKGKSYLFPDALVIESSPTVLKVAVSDDAKQAKTADFTFNMAALEDIPEPKATATLAAKTAYKKAVAEREAITAAMAVGQTVSLNGTYDSFSPNPLMITMKDGAVVLKAAPKPAPKAAPATTVHHTATKK